MELFKGGSLKSLLEASSLIGAVLYALGWVFTARVFAGFGVTPEEVGFTFAFLLIRVVFLVIAVPGFVALVVLLDRFAISDRSSFLTVDRIIYAVVIGLVLVGAISFFRTVGWSADNIKVIVCLLVAVAAGIAQRFVARRETRNGPTILDVHSFNPYGDPVQTIGSGSASSRRWRSYVTFLLALISVAAFLTVPFFAADRYADQIRDGKELEPSVLPGIAGLMVQRLRITTTDHEPIAPGVGRSKCLDLFGASDGVVVLYRPNSPYDHESDLVIRVPQGRVTLDDSCS